MIYDGIFEVFIHRNIIYYIILLCIIFVWYTWYNRVFFVLSGGAQDDETMDGLRGSPIFQGQRSRVSVKVT